MCSCVARFMFSRQRNFNVQKCVHPPTSQPCPNRATSWDDSPPPITTVLYCFVTATSAPAADWLDHVCMLKCTELPSCDWLIRNLCWQAVIQVYVPDKGAGEWALFSVRLSTKWSMDRYWLPVRWLGTHALQGHWNLVGFFLALSDAHSTFCIVTHYHPRPQSDKHPHTLVCAQFWVTN